MPAERAAPDPRIRSGSARRGPIALVADEGGDPDADLNALMLRRIRLGSFVFLAAYTAFLVRDLTGGRYDVAYFQSRTLAAALVAQVVLTTLGWSRWPRTLARLRVIEWATLGVCASTLAVTQFAHLTNEAVARQYLQVANPEDGQIVLSSAWMLPWYALIAGTSVLLPNTARRTLLVCAPLAMLPLAVTVAATLTTPLLAAASPHVMFVQLSVWGGLVVAMSVFGAHRSDRLRREAREAKRFGQYRLARKLGGGGMGEVYLAEHLLLRRPSVIKVIRPDRATDPHVLKRFEREVRILATLTHWNTVEVFDYGHTADGTFYFVMEYLPGLNLDELVGDHGPLPACRVVYLMRQVCAALREAHAAGLIHRDIKPGNVMVCHRGGVPDVAKLLDFGLVHAAEDDRPGSDPAGKITTEGVILGTPHYMSPEQAAGRPLDGRSDIYSLAATAYFLLTGRPPFDKPRVLEVIAAHMLEPPTPPRAVNPGVPADLDAVLVRALAKNPADRFASVADLDVALRACGCAAEWDEPAANTWWERNRPTHEPIRSAS